jgi:hypothetical protein
VAKREKPRDAQYCRCKGARRHLKSGAAGARQPGAREHPSDRSAGHESQQMPEDIDMLGPGPQEREQAYPGE